MSYAEAASFLRAALLLGLLSPEDVIAWSDQIISEDPCPPAFTYTLSLTRPELSSVREVLRPVALSAEPLGVIEAVLGLAARDMASGRRTVDDTLRVLTQLRRFLELDPRLNEEITVLEHGHMLAVAGLTDQLEQTRMRVVSFVNRYAHVAPPTDTRSARGHV